jgi:release factor glutamine methyltransferase
VRVYAVDICSDALDTAHHNALRHGVESHVIFLKGKLLEPLPEAVDIVVANLPYVKSGEFPNPYEPELALDGGIGGLDIIVQLIKGIKSHVAPGGRVLLEVGQGQVSALFQIITQTLPGAILEKYQDLAGIERVIMVTLPQT